MKISQKSRPLFWFYILVGYVILQFVWWTYLMVNLNNEIYHLKTELNLLKGESPEEIITKGNELNEKLHNRWIMIAGESSVFIGLLLLGIFQTRKTFKKEAELTQQQKNFLLSVTHELKSPIASTRLQLETLQLRELSREKQKEIIANAISDTDRLNNLVSTLLQAAQIENSIYSVNKEESNLSDHISEIMNQAMTSFRYKQKIVLNIEPGIIMDIDKANFQSIVLNIFENAVKYSSEDSTITVELKKQNNRIVFSITDQGIGIPDDTKKAVFQKFYRIGNEETRNTKGTGLGLYIVKYLVEQHGGTITVKNNVPKGTVFEVVF